MDVNSVAVNTINVPISNNNDNNDNNNYMSNNCDLDNDTDEFMYKNINDTIEENTL